MKIVDFILDFLTDKRIVRVMSLIMSFLIVALFFALIDVSTGLKEVIRQKEQEMYYESSPSKIKYYHDDVNLINDGAAATNLVNCYKSPIEGDKINDDIKKKIIEINNFYASNSQYFSFLYKDLYTSFTVSYNENAPIFTASTIKGPAMIYLFEEASKGNINLDEQLVYTSNFYHGGSGVLQHKPVNTSYKVGTLIEYAIHDSDNIAYAMLMNRYKRENVLSFWQGKGTKNIFTLNTIWGVTSAKDASIYMQELYDFSNNDKEFGTKLMGYFKDAGWKMITNKKGEYTTANKGGWSGTAIHDAAIVFDENPYILVVLSNTGEANYNYLFKKMNVMVGELHELYWRQKDSICRDIKQY